MNDEDLNVAQGALRKRLVDSGRLILTSVDGIYGRDGTYEAVLAGVKRRFQAARTNDNVECVEYPPVIPTSDFEKVGYLRNFPDLVGPVFTFVGDQTEHRKVLERLDNDQPYADLMSQAEVALTPACCYSIYPGLGGALDPDGRTFETSGYCFRHEPSTDPMRMQSFRQLEEVRVADEATVIEWRSVWLERVADIFEDFGLDTTSDIANDPFFGRAGRMLKASQRDQELKIEFLVNVYDTDHRTACTSVNHHREHFGHMFGITSADADAHSACIGIGIDRITIALFSRYGTDVVQWPNEIRRVLTLS